MSKHPQCEAGDWPGKHVGPPIPDGGDCPNEASHAEYWFDDEGVEVWLCDVHSE